jgi:NitT/TauT family transport system ATP-binding protein
VEALADIGLAVEPNAFVSVIGPSGCGKSTLLKIVCGVLRQSSGEVRIDGRPLQRADISGRFGFVFQRPLLLPWRSALSNVLLPLEVVRSRVGAAERAKACEFLDLVGLADFGDASPHELSGGMQQRVALARALVIEPEILLMDEPFSALDEITREAMQAQLLEIWQQTRTTVLFVTHHIEEAVLLSERVVVLSNRPGTVVRTIDVDLPRPRDAEIREDPRFRQIVRELRSLLLPAATRGLA